MLICDCKQTKCWHKFIIVCAVSLSSLVRLTYNEIHAYVGLQLRIEITAILIFHWINKFWQRQEGNRCSEGWGLGTARGGERVQWGVGERYSVGWGMSTWGRPHGAWRALSSGHSGVMLTRARDVRGQVALAGRARLLDVTNDDMWSLMSTVLVSLCHSLIADSK